MKRSFFFYLPKLQEGAYFSIGSIRTGDSDKLIDYIEAKSSFAISNQVRPEADMRKPV